MANGCGNRLASLFHLMHRAPIGMLMSLLSLTRFLLATWHSYWSRNLKIFPISRPLPKIRRNNWGFAKMTMYVGVLTFFSALSALYENRELAALHFRKVLFSRPNSLLAGESRFWLWFLDVLNTPNSAGLTSHELIKRLNS